MKIAPMLATLGTQDDLQCSNCIFEPKLDGYRALCFVDQHGFRLQSRNGLDLTEEFPEFSFRRCIKAKQCILDGEIIMVNQQGIPDFNLLQRRALHELGDYQAYYIVFDIIEYEHVLQIDKPLLERKKLLQKVIRDCGALQCIPYTHDGPSLWHTMKRHHFEGVMAKKVDSLYKPGYRTPAWIKIKFVKTIDIVIVGFTQENRAISALAGALYDNNKLYYTGKVGTGYNEQTIHLLYKKLKPLVVATAPVVNAEQGDPSILWVRPRYSAEVKYAQLTRDRFLRSPVFIRLRTDKPLSACTFIQ